MAAYPKNKKNIVGRTLFKFKYYIITSAWNDTFIRLWSWEREGLVSNDKKREWSITKTQSKLRE